MASGRQAIAGLAVAALFLILLVAGLGLSLAEGQFSITPEPPSVTPTLSPTATRPTDPTQTASPTSTVSPTFTQNPTASPCPTPPGWAGYTVNPGDTLEALAAVHQVSIDELIAANCLTVSSLPAGSKIYVPQPTPTATASPTASATEPRATMPPAVACGPPASWVRYRVVRGDTLFSLSRAFGVTVPMLRLANCLGSSNLIIAGQYLWVPNVPTITPTASRTTSPTLTASPVPASPTAPGIPPGTSTPTQTSVPQPTSTPTMTVSPTETVPLPTATATGTLGATDTEPPTLTPSPSPTTSTNGREE